MLTEVNLPFEAGESAEEFVDALGPLAEHYPHMVEMVTVMITGQAYDYGDEFDYGLTLILDGIEAAFRGRS